MARKKLKQVAKPTSPSAVEVLNRSGVKPVDSTPLDGSKQKVCDPILEASARGSIAGHQEDPYILEPYSPSVSQTLGEGDSSSGTKEAMKSDGLCLLLSEASSGNHVVEEPNAAPGKDQGQAALVDVGSDHPEQLRVASMEGQSIVPTAARGADQSLEGQTKAATPWVGLFKDNRQQKKGLLLNAFEVEGNRAVIELQDVDEIEKDWGFCLVGFIAGNFPGKDALLRLCDSWGVNYQFFTHSSGWLVFKFPDADSREVVMQKGPFSVFGRPLLLKYMAPDFDFDLKPPLLVPVWVSLPNLPLSCWSARALGKITSIIGRPITTDGLTASKERISFARVMVEIDPSKELKRSIEIQLPSGRIRQQKVVYENEPKFCSMCKILGHTAAACKRNASKAQGRVSAGAKPSRAIPKSKVLEPSPHDVVSRAKEDTSKSRQDASFPQSDGGAGQIVGDGGHDSLKGKEAEIESSSLQAPPIPCNDGPKGPFRTVMYRKLRNGKAVGSLNARHIEDVVTHLEVVLTEQASTNPGAPVVKGSKGQENSSISINERLKGPALPALT